MLRKTYIENFKCLDKFDIEYENLCLLLGENGSGKSSLFEALQKLQRFIAGDSLSFRASLASDVFQKDQLTRWKSSNVQRFTLEVDGNGGKYTYNLEIEHSLDSPEHKARMRNESLTFNSQSLFKFWIEDGQGKAHLYNDNPEHRGVHLPIFNWSQSVIAQANEREDNTKLIWFKNYISKLLFVHVNPFAIETYSSHSIFNPDSSMSDYVSWYRTLADQYQGVSGFTHFLFDFLEDALPGFRYLEFQSSGDKKGLFASFQSGDTYKLSELSQGQKAIIILYTIVSCLGSENRTVFIDEPENFVSLKEIQPWLNEIKDLCFDGRSQVVLASHHPSIINNLAGSVGYWFSRKEHQNATCRKLSENDPDGLSTSQLMELGWLDDEQ